MPCTKNGHNEKPNMHGFKSDRVVRLYAIAGMRFFTQEKAKVTPIE